MHSMLQAVIGSGHADSAPGKCWRDAGCGYRKTVPARQPVSRHAHARHGHLGLLGRVTCKQCRNIMLT
jgi:hypothetical protein